MIWSYPEGIAGKRLEERSIHGVTPDWVPDMKTEGIKAKGSKLSMAWSLSAYDSYVNSSPQASDGVMSNYCTLYIFGTQPCNVIFLTRK